MPATTRSGRRRDRGQGSGDRDREASDNLLAYCLRVAIRSFRDLLVWQLSVELAVEVYALTKTFPKEEQFGLTSQLRRAAVSIAANIAEGHGRLHRGDFLHHLSFARGSLAEAETHLIIANRIALIDDEMLSVLEGRCGEIGRVLNGLIRSLAPDPRSPIPIEQLSPEGPFR